jgi:RNA polymerase sigma-70 factor (ECF subfamily)
VTDLAWIDAALVSARPQAVAALLRYFRDLDLAEEAYQDACLRALKNWPKNGPPRDAAAWLIMVGRNAAIDVTRRRAKQTELPDEDQISDLSDVETEVVQRLDEADYRDDVLRLLFICCHPDIPPTQQVALALRIVSGLTVPQIARAFLVGESAMEQRITRAKAKVAGAGVPFEAPNAIDRAARLASVAAMVYLVFNEGYSAADPASDRASLCDEAIRLARLLLRMYPSEPEIMGLIAALHARASTPADTDWAQIDLLYGTLERLTPSPVVTLNRAVAVSKVRGPEPALAMVEPLGERLAATSTSTACAAVCSCSWAARRKPARRSTAPSRLPPRPPRPRIFVSTWIISRSEAGARRKYCVTLSLSKGDISNGGAWRRASTSSA